MEGKKNICLFSPTQVCCRPKYILTPSQENMPDFLAAARRHLDDGDFLHQHSRMPNAVQLWAYGAECTLKALALKQNLFALDTNSGKPKTVEADGKPSYKFAQHLNENKNDRPDLLSLYNAAQTGPSSVMGPSTAFTGWDIKDRYEDGTQLQPKIDEYKSDAAFFRTMLNSAMLPEGL